MGGKDSNYQVVYRGEQLTRYVPDGWVMFQRAREHGGGFWFGRTYDNCFWLEFDQPTSLSAALEYLVHLNRNDPMEFVEIDDFKLT